MYKELCLEHFEQNYKKIKFLAVQGRECRQTFTLHSAATAFPGLEQLTVFVFLLFLQNLMRKSGSN